jgi:hypothetical protein
MGKVKEERQKGKRKRQNMDRQNRTGYIHIPAQDRLNGTGRTVQAEQDIQQNGPSEQKVHIQNVPRQNVPTLKRPKYKTYQSITSQLQNVSILKRSSYKTSQASKCPNPERPKYKTSQL